MSNTTPGRKARWVPVLGAAVSLALVLSACSAPTRKVPADSGAKAPSASNQAPAAEPAKSGYPNKPIKLIITHSPGGANDMAARIVAPFLEKALGQPVVVENMPGAGGNLARAFVYKQPADGYNLLVSSIPSMDGGKVANNGEFEPMKYTHIYNLSGNNFEVVAVPAKSPIKTMKDLQEASAKKPLSSAGSGVGTNSYFAAVLLKDKAKINLTYVPFNSGKEAATAVAGGQVDMGTGAPDSFLPLAEQGLVRILGHFGDKRDPHAKDVPGLAELGYKDLWLDQLTGVLAPPGTPKEVVDTLAAAFDKAFKDPGLNAAAEKAKLNMLPLGPAEFEKAHKVLNDMVMGMADQLKAASKQ